MTTRFYEVRGVLAGAYRGGPRGGMKTDQQTRTHYYDVGAGGSWEAKRTLCGRIKSEHLCDVAEEGAATCPACVKRFECLMSTIDVTIDVALAEIDAEEAPKP